MYKKITALWMSTLLTCLYLLSVPVMAAEIKALEFTFYAAYSSSGTFTPPVTGKYKIYTVGKSGDGATSSDYIGGGGGGSGGIAVSILKLDANKSYTFVVSTEKTSWNNDECYATAGTNGSGVAGGNGGAAITFNLAGSDGFKGGAGGTSSSTSNGNAYGTDGTVGGNNGMKGGLKGRGYSDCGGSNNVGGGGGGGGASLPSTYCKYVVDNLSAYSAGTAGAAWITDYHKGSGTAGLAANVYPEFNQQNLQLFGGGGGSGGKSYATYGSAGNGTATGLGGAASAGTPGVVIIERCTDQIAPTITSMEFSANKKRITLTAMDEYGVAGFHINGEFQEGNPLTYQIPSGTTELQIRAEDNAGLLSTMEYVDVLPSAPTITVVPNKAWINRTDDKALVTLSTDAAGAFEGVKLIYSLDNASWQEYSSSFAVSATSIVYAKITCTAGESETAQKEIKVDKQPPSIVSAVVDESDMEHRTLTITASDNGGSGVKTIYVDGSPHEENPYVYSIPAGQETINLQVDDIAGNQSDPIEQSVRHVDTIPPTIDSVEFAGDGSAVEIRMSDDTYGYGVKGVYVNGDFKAGDTVMMGIPDTVAILYLQAEDNEGNLSDIMRVRVPSRSVITGKLTIDSVAFNEDNTQATITASSTDPAATVTGIYADGELLDDNPVTYEIPEGAQFISLQAVNNEGDKSEIVTKRVPGWSEEIESIVVTSAEFSSNETITAYAEDSRGLAIRGIYFNAAFLPENPATYEIPEGTQRVFIQALNIEGDKSEPVTKRVPGWTEVVDTMTVDSVTVSADSRTAEIVGSSTGLPISGFLVNDEYYPGNPLTYSIPSGIAMLDVQAMNAEGDLSAIVTKEIPRRSSSGGGGSSDDSDSSSGKKATGNQKAVITIVQSEWLNGRGKIKVNISATAPGGIKSIEATTDMIKSWKDITKTGYFELTGDAKILVKVTDKQGRVTTARKNIRCIDNTAPTVQVVQEGAVARISGKDDLSGIVSYYVNGMRHDGDALVDGQLLYDIPLGTGTLVVQSEDAAGNLSQELNFAVDRVQIQPPATLITAAPVTSAPVSIPDADLQKQLDQLKAENEKLQKENTQLQQTVQKQKDTILQLKLPKVAAPDLSVTTAPQQADPPAVPAESSAITSPSTTNMPRVAVIAAAILCFAALMTTIFLIVRKRNRPVYDE